MNERWPCQPSLGLLLPGVFSWKGTMRAFSLFPSRLLSLRGRAQTACVTEDTTGGPEVALVIHVEHLRKRAPGGQARLVLWRAVEHCRGVPGGQAHLALEKRAGPTRRGPERVRRGSSRLPKVSGLLARCSVLSALASRPCR